MAINSTHPVTDWIFPRRCLVCNDDLSEGELCICCSSLCSPGPKLSSLMGNKLDALFYFELTIRKLIKISKYNKDPCAVHLLFKLVRERLYFSGLIDDLKSFDPSAITYVPSHWFSRVLRGVELPMVFAQSLAKELKVPVVTLLRRRQFFGRQALRNNKSERRAFIQGAFRKLESKKHYMRLLLVDDVTTTGATFNETKKILKEVCGDIRLMAIAKTP